MSLPPELRVICFQLSSTPASDLPQHLPTLLQHIRCCQVSLSNAGVSVTKADASNASVLVHTLKTQLSTLLTGKSVEGRFSATVLIKAVIEVGGWEILQSSESWVRGLLAVLGKPDPVASKEICVIALTKVFLMTHKYQTLLREITTPTLPTFVTSCLNLLSTKPSSKISTPPSSLAETIFRSFTVLIPRHTSIFRPFASQLRIITRTYLAPTLQERSIVSEELKESARDLFVALFQTAAKNTGGDEWAKSVREIVKDIHGTADNVFRAVVEDWESTAGYTGEPVDINREPAGGGKGIEEFSPWSGVLAGTDRLTGMLDLLARCFRVATPGSVTIPLGSILDVTTRMLSITIPSSSEHHAATNVRLHPAIGREERDMLCVYLPQVYISTLGLIEAILDRLQENAIPMAQIFLDQIVWIFVYGKHINLFRLMSFNVVAKLLQSISKDFERPQVAKMGAIIKSCCHELYQGDVPLEKTNVVDSGGKKFPGTSYTASHNMDTFFQSPAIHSSAPAAEDTEVRMAAANLLPLFLSHLSQQHIEVSVRSLIERTAILSKNKEAMLASILNPFVGNNGKPMASILPYLTSEFGSDDVVEVLLRPRMPFLPSGGAGGFASHDVGQGPEDEEMDFQDEVEPSQRVQDSPVHVPALQSKGPFHAGLGPAIAKEVGSHPPSAFDDQNRSFPAAPTSTTFNILPTKPLQSSSSYPNRLGDADIMQEDTSDDESVHLTMQLDTESESEGE